MDQNTTATSPAPAATLLTPAEAATMLAVNPRTLARWSASDRLPVVRTLGGHRRYRAEDIAAIAAPATAG